MTPKPSHPRGRPFLDHWSIWSDWWRFNHIKNSKQKKSGYPRFRIVSRRPRSNSQSHDFINDNVLIVICFIDPSNRVAAQVPSSSDADPESTSEFKWPIASEVGEGHGGKSSHSSRGERKKPAPKEVATSRALIDLASRKFFQMIFATARINTCFLNLRHKFDYSTKCTFRQ